MSRQSLQKFGFKESPYARPNQDWVCGYAAEGRACPQGPSARGRCSGGQHCAPLQQEGRWTCTRSDLFGGKCASGPLPDGSCGATMPPCQPRRSVKARRRLTTRWVAAFVVGLLMLMLGGRHGLAMLEPGPRVHAHAQLGTCEVCHAAVEHPMSLWPAFGAAGAPDDSERCLQCHTVGEAPKLAHGQPAHALAALAPDVPAGGGSPAVMMASNWLVNPQQALECGQCHREHRGFDADLTAMSNARCQSCHSDRFDSFGDGHPEFQDYPAKRRTLIRFDHAEHIAKYFPEADGPAPEACADCHITAQEQGLMVLRGFEAACSDCHAGDIAGAGRADSPGLAVLQVPGFDLAALRAAGLATGDWPEFAESEGGAFFASLMQADAATSTALTQLEDADWLDLGDADADTLQAAHQVIWGFKRLLLEMKNQGPMRLLDRLVAAGRIPADTNLKELMGGLSVNTVEAAIGAWFPELEEEWTAHQDGSLEVKAPTRRPPPKREPEEESFDESAFDDLFGGGGGDDLFGGGDEINLDAISLDDDTEADEPEPEADPMEPARLDERMRAGGWYLDDMSLRYRPAGHADSLLRAWLSHADSAMTRETLMDPASPGRCTKCHSVDQQDESFVVNWYVRRPDANRHEFTAFSHSSHFSLMGEDGCTACHRLNPEADYNAGFEDADPHSFASNFHNLEKAKCATCHNPAQAGDDCTSCHNYHIGEFAATEPVTTLSEALDTPEL